MFDGLLNEAEEIVSLDAPSLRGLSYALRHRETWPAGFVWDYRSCDNCAMGLAAKLWAAMGAPCRYAMSMAFEISEERAGSFFFDLGVNKQIDMYDITPEHVADAIDAYLAEAA